VAALIFGIGAREIPWIYGSLRCGVPPDDITYIAYCTSETEHTFGDYEIGAFAYGLEPGSLRNAQKADVLILGNSHSQVAMSTPEFDSFFVQRRVPYFLLGFGFYSRSAMALHLMAKHRMHPKVVIVNADPFFSPGPQQKEQQVLDGRIYTRYEYFERMVFDLIHTPICSVEPSSCKPSYRTIFRSRANGGWTYKDTLWWSQYTQPLAETALVGDDGSTEVARDFIKNFGLDPRCVIVTAVPSSFINSYGMAHRIAGAIGSPFFVPNLNDLRSYDGDHLTKEDSGRWSKAFLEMSGPTIEKCLGRPPIASSM
jgi:hypothetical protein